MDDPEFREIVIEFVDRLHANLDKMRSAASVKDYQTLGGLAHWLKGSAGTAGFNARRRRPCPWNARFKRAIRPPSRPPSAKLHSSPIRS